MLRNNSKLDLCSNGKRRNGQFEWHDRNCQIEDYGIKWSNGKPMQHIWCATHGQWAHETPISVSYTFEDGTVASRSLLR